MCDTDQPLLSSHFFHSPQQKSAVSHVLFNVAKGSSHIEGTLFAQLNPLLRGQVLSGLLLAGSFLAEGQIGDPLMTLPRYTDIGAASRIDEVRVIGKEAGAYAEQNKAVELEYYDIVCAPTYGALPTLAP